MSISSGFYNSLNHDRKYFTTDFARLFDGIIRDGIFSTIGTCFIVEAYEGLTVNVGVGLAWFNHSWTYNDAILPIDGIQSEVLLDRIDALVLESNGEDSVRDNDIFFIKGTPSSTPQRPSLIHTKLVDQRPLCYIHRRAGIDEIRQADISNMVGTDECPFVSGILQTISIDQVLPQWRDELDRFIESEETRWSVLFEALKESILANKEALDNWIDTEEREYAEHLDNLKQNSLEAYENLTDEMNSLYEDFKEYVRLLKRKGDTDLAEITQQLLDFRNANEAEFLAWFERIKGIFGTDLGGKMQEQIDALSDSLNNLAEMLYSGMITSNLLTSEGDFIVTDTGKPILLNWPVCSCKA